MCLWTDNYDKKAFPLFQYCPVYTAVLEEGDVLFNPPWWWHSIKNISDTTIGVASRWHTDGIAGHNFLTTEENYNIYTIGKKKYN
jgi:oxalate decarboxylase/phosphoglucose isomerase-like protein (cupin superfamily)